MANLLNNAVKYSPNGGEIVVTTRVEGNAAHVAVRDHGIGIAEAALETIFERYGRVESLATRHIQGTGLGLPIVRQIVQLHGGTVWAESTVGEGSVFHVRLPRGAAAGSAVSEVAP
jgi:signal transduction histidine kinase